MTDSPVIFRPACDDREIAMLGVLDVGEIGRYDAGMAYWRLWLPGCVGFGRAAHPKAAREYLTAKAEQWIEAAGLVAVAKPEIRAFRSDDWGKIKQGAAMKKPVRLQLSRRKGFNLQALSMATNGRVAVNVARPGTLGNPFIVGKHGTRAECVDLFKKMCGGYLCLGIGNLDAQRASIAAINASFDDLRGKNLACWCSGSPCHGDVLLEIANRKVPQGWLCGGGA